MGNVFGLDVIEVQDVRVQKKTYMGAEQQVIYAQLLCEGGVHRVKVQDGVEIPIGYSGKAAGYCSSRPCKVEIFTKQGKVLTDAVLLEPSLITQFVPIAAVKRASNALSSFMGSDASQKSGAAELPKMPTNK